MCRDFSSETIADTPPDMQDYLRALAVQSVYREGVIDTTEVEVPSIPTQEVTRRVEQWQHPRTADEMLGRTAILETAQAIPTAGARTYYMRALRETANRNARVRTR